jgi:hypothetical protein
MSWRLIFLLSLLSIPMGFASLLGLTGSYEWLMWLAVGIFSAWRFATKTKVDLFLHGFYLGILDGIFNSVIQSIFFRTYLANNPRMVDAFSSLPQDLSPKLVLLIMGPIIGVVSGVAFGIITVVAGSLVRRPATADDPSPSKKP